MAEQFVGKIAEFKDGDRRIIFAGDNEIGVFRHEGQFYAYSNFCLHQGGPPAKASPSPRSKSGSSRQDLPGSHFRKRDAFRLPVARLRI